MEEKKIWSLKLEEPKEEGNQRKNLSGKKGDVKSNNNNKVLKDDLRPTYIYIIEKLGLRRPKHRKSAEFELGSSRKVNKKTRSKVKVVNLFIVCINIYLFLTNTFSLRYIFSMKSYPSRLKTFTN